MSIRRPRWTLLLAALACAGIAGADEPSAPPSTGPGLKPLAPNAHLMPGLKLGSSMPSPPPDPAMVLHATTARPVKHIKLSKCMQKAHEDGLIGMDRKTFLKDCRAQTAAER